MNVYDSAINVTEGFLAAAAENAKCGGDIAHAAGQVISRRIVLGMVATFNPLEANYTELSRMVPEKVEAFSTAGMVMLEQSGQAHRQIMRAASEELRTTAHAAIEMTGCLNVASLSAVQRTFACEWFTRTASIWIAMGLQAFVAPAAAMEPVRLTVVANAERLSH